VHSPDPERPDPPAVRLRVRAETKRAICPVANDPRDFTGYHPVAAADFGHHGRACDGIVGADGLSTVYAQGRCAEAREDQSTPVYYAAFVLDPDGNNMEAVFRGG